MRAISYDRYGDASVLALGDLPEPPALRRGQVLVRVTHAALNPKDALFRKGKFRILSGRRFPKQCGIDAAGVVLESRGGGFGEGQRVFGCLDEWTIRRGTLAERAVFAENELARIPDGVSDEDAASVALAGLTALQAFCDVAETRPGHRVLVNGASGGVGTLAVQIARIFGAEIHSVTSGANRALARELGASEAWSYDDDAWTKAGPFDTIFDVFGNLRYARVRALLASRGRFVSTVPSVPRALRDVASRLRARQERLVVVRPRTRDLELLGAWLSDGRLRAVIDSRFAIDDVQAAFARLESKRTRGKIVIRVP